jgi:uncharacterized membrane protein YgdD (TMEM256/DUF423 family)
MLLGSFRLFRLALTGIERPRFFIPLGGLGLLGWAALGLQAIRHR